MTTSGAPGRKGGEDSSGVAVEDHQRGAIGGAEQPLAVDLEWIRSHSGMQIEVMPQSPPDVPKLSERITFTGRLDHRYSPLALAAADVLVVPSVIPEAFGMVAVEGASAGCLPLVARHSGWPRWPTRWRRTSIAPDCSDSNPGPERRSGSPKRSAASCLSRPSSEMNSVAKSARSLGEHRRGIEQPRS
jgi:hypothetical protein